MPVHPPPDHPVKVEPLFGVAVRVTTVPLANAAEQLLVHPSIPLPGLVVTDPDPVTMTVNKGGSCQLAGGVWSQGSPVAGVGRVGGVAHGLFTKSKYSFMLGCAASRPVRADRPKRASTIVRTEVVSRTVCETKFLME